MMDLYIGTAGWTVPKQHLSLFPGPGGEGKSSHLQRYAHSLPCVEVNSTFSRPHRRNTWERWAAATPANFRFSVKLARTITHTAKLVNTGSALQEFFAPLDALGEKLGPVLVQLPPRLAFDEGVAHEFFTTLRELYPGEVVLEPRHPGWFSHAAEQLLMSFEVARVASDPPQASERAASPAGWPGLNYWRLHGSPRTYYSEYGSARLDDLVHRLNADRTRRQAEQTWVIFDNTALGHAAADAHSLAKRLL